MCLQTFSLFQSSKHRSLSSTSLTTSGSRNSAKFPTYDFPEQIASIGKECLTSEEISAARCQIRFNASLACPRGRLAFQVLRFSSGRDETRPGREQNGREPIWNAPIVPETRFFRHGQLTISRRISTTPIVLDFVSFRSRRSRDLVASGIRREARRRDAARASAASIMPSRELPPAANLTSRRSLSLSLSLESLEEETFELNRTLTRLSRLCFAVLCIGLLGKFVGGVFDSRYIFRDNPCVSLVDTNAGLRNCVFKRLSNASIREESLRYIGHFSKESNSVIFQQSFYTATFLKMFVLNVI